MLTLSENPVCKESEYKMIVLAYVDTIKYLDYALIDPTERATAKEQYHDELLDVEEKESVLAEKSARDQQLDQYLAKLDAACVLFAHTIFDDLFAEDSDVEKLKHMPGVKEQIEQFRSSFKNSSEEFIRTALERFEKKRKEITDFESTVRRVRSEDDQESTGLIETFTQSKKKSADLIAGPYSNMNSAETQKIVKTLQVELENTCDELMNKEIRLVEKFEALVDEFENRLTELKTEALEAQQLFFRSVEDLEERFSSGVRAVATDLIDRLAREELAEDFLDDEAMSLVVDKDTCMGVLSASHDMHIGRILKREDEARGIETKRFQQKMSFVVNEEASRNRDRILQIHEFNKVSQASLHALLSNDEDEDEDDHRK
jgi:hypothetical protein